jgi:hypothetical protein
MRLRYFDLKERGIVKNRVTLGNWIKKQKFPKGQLTGPNTRTWDEETEVNPWLASRPTAPKPTPKSPGRKPKTPATGAAGA